jgi:hypothetical protein
VTARGSVSIISPEKGSPPYRMFFATAKGRGFWGKSLAQAAPRR